MTAARLCAGAATLLAACTFKPPFPTNVACANDDDCRAIGGLCGERTDGGQRVCCAGCAGGAVPISDGGTSRDGGAVVIGDGGTSPDGGAGSAIQGMALISFPAGNFWIDAYEASLVPGVGKLGSGNLDMDGDGKIADLKTAMAHARSHGFQFDEDPDHPGQVDPNEAGVVLTTVVAQSLPYRPVALNMTFWQAAAACANAGKRLCTGTEWIWACQGAGANTGYPYGNQFDGADEAGKDCWTSNLGSLAFTGTASACVTPQGIYDMSGNADEMTDIVGGVVQARGGWAYGNLYSAACTAASTGRPDYSNGTWGFRCCRDP
jgi:hypothetical protein